MTDVDSQLSWKGSDSSETPPDAWDFNTPPGYEFTISSGGNAPDSPLIYIGSAPVNGVLHIPWTYALGIISDLGANVNVSFDGGTTWTNTTVVASSGGMTTSGTLSLTIPGGATGIKVAVKLAGGVGG